MKQFESIDDVYVYYADKIRNAQTVNRTSKTGQ